MLSRVVVGRAAALKSKAGKKSIVINKRFASELINAAQAKPHPKEMTQLAEESFASIQQFKKQASVLAQLDEQLRVLDHKKLVAAVAQAKNKSVEAVTELEVYEYQLQEREKFVQSVDLTKQPLFSAKVALDRFLARKKDIDAMGNVPAEAKTLLQQEEQRLRDLVANEEIVEVEVDADLYEQVKKNLFPSFKNVSAEEFRDLLAGRGGPTAELVASAEEAAKNNSPNATNLKSQVAALRLQQTGFADKAAVSVSKKLGREVTPGDINPEKRLEFGGVQTIHPLLQADPKIYIPGEFKNLPNTLPLNRAELEKDPSKLAAAVDSVSSKLEKVEFTPTHFNPPGLAREVSEEDAARMGVLDDVKRASLDFTMYEGPQAKVARNASELVIQLKLWKFWNYIFPYLTTEADRKNFMEQFDVSPGERTLEWTLSWPPPDHTFIEVPIFKENSDPAHAQTADETVAWPRYRVWTDRVFEAEVQSKKHHGHEEIEVKNIKAIPLSPSQQQLADQIKQLEAQLAPSN